MPNQRSSVCTILAGPNGGGKSSIYDMLSVAGPFINVDVLAREISSSAPEKVSIGAGRRALQMLKRLVAAKSDFVYETTLSSNQSLRLMKECRAAGYEIALVFVALASPELHIARVAERVAKGGHDIPPATIRRRYVTAFAKLPEAIAIAGEVMLVDNSRLKPEPVLTINSGSVKINHLVPSRDLHCRFAKAAAAALGITAAQLLFATKQD